MSKEVYCVNPGTRLSDLARELTFRKHSGAPVVDTNYKLLGIVSLSDVVGQIAGVAPLRPELSEICRTIWGRKRSLPEATEEQPDPQVSDFMNSSVVTVEPSASVQEAARLVREHRIHRLVVTEQSKVVGVVTTTDILGAFLEEEDLLAPGD